MICGTAAEKDVAVIELGDFYQLGQSVVTKLSKENNIKATLINPIMKTNSPKALTYLVLLDCFLI